MTTEVEKIRSIVNDPAILQEYQAWFDVHTNDSPFHTPLESDDEELQYIQHPQIHRTTHIRILLLTAPVTVTAS